MQNAGVLAAADDAGIAGHHAMREKMTLDFGSHFPLVAARPCRLHGPHVRLGADAPRLGHDLDLVGRLDQPQLMQGRLQRLHAGRRLGAASGDLAQLAQGAGHQAVERGMLAKGVVQGFAAGKQLRQLGFKSVECVGLIGAVARHRAFRTGTAPVPNLAFGVARPHEQHERAFLAARAEHGNRLGLGKASEVMKVAVLPERIMRVARAHLFPRRRDDRHPPFTERPHQRGAALCVCRGRQCTLRERCGSGMGSGRSSM